MRRARHNRLYDKKWQRDTGQTPAEHDAFLDRQLDALTSGSDAEPWPDGGDDDLVGYVERWCGWGNCITVFDPKGKPTMGTGPVACPCTWSDRLQGRRWGMGPLPSTPVKAVGRHGSKVQASRARSRRALRRSADFGALLSAATPPWLARPA